MAQRSFENCQLEEDNTLVSKSLKFLACCTLFLTLVIGSGFWQIHFKDSLTLEIVGCMSIQKKNLLTGCHMQCPVPRTDRFARFRSLGDVGSWRKKGSRPEPQKRLEIDEDDGMY